MTFFSVKALDGRAEPGRQILPNFAGVGLLSTPTLLFLS